MTPMIRCGIVALFGAVALAPVSASGQAEIPAVVVAVRENAERLKSGEFVATGGYSVNYLRRSSSSIDRKEIRKAIKRRIEKGIVTPPRQPDVRPVRFRETLNCVFDYESDRLSFGRTRQLDGKVDAQVDWTRYVGTPDVTILVRDLQGHNRPEVALMNPLPPTEVSKSVRPIYHPATIGFAGLNRIARYNTKSFLEGLEDTLTITELGDGIHRLEVRRAGPEPELRGVVWTWWCDEKQGFHPVKFETRYQFLNPSTERQKAQNLAAKPVEESRCVWKQINEVWVLSSLYMKSERGDVVSKLKLTFDWKSVNQGVSDDHFDWRKWDLPKRSRVVDLRPDPKHPVLVEEIGVSVPIRKETTEEQ